MWTKTSSQIIAVSEIFDNFVQFDKYWESESNPNNNMMIRQACLALETHLIIHTCSTMPDLRFELRLTNFIFTSKMKYVDYVHWSCTSQIILFCKPRFSSLCFRFVQFYEKLYWMLTIYLLCFPLFCFSFGFYETS